MSTTTAPLPVGAPAPAITLASTSGAQVALADFHGKRHVLLAFFPLAFTSVCTSELCAFGDDFDAFAESGVEVLPVSVDAVPSLKEFRAKHDMKVELLSDFRREAAAAFGVLRPEGFSERAYFLIDRDGIIRWAHVEAHPGLKRENAEILAAIKNVTA